MRDKSHLYGDNERSDVLILDGHQSGGPASHVDGFSHYSADYLTLACDLDQEQDDIVEVNVKTVTLKE